MLKHLAGLFLVFAAVTVSWASSADQWVEVRSPHFVVLTNSNEKEARQVVGQFERMRSVFHMLFPVATDDANSPIIVLVLKNEKSFLDLAPEGEFRKQEFSAASTFLRTPDKDYVLLLLDVPVNHPGMVLYNPWQLVYRDYTVYMLRNADAWLPLWLKDGFAEFYANTDIEDKYAVLGESSEGEINVLRRNHLLPLTTLLQLDRMSPSLHNGETGIVFYAESWALTHYLILHDSENKTQQIQEYVRLLMQHKDSITAAQEAFGDLTKLQQSLEAYVRQSSFKEYKLNTATVLDESSFQVRSVPTPEADAIRADVLVNTKRTQDAQALLDAVLQEDPKNVRAHETMGALKFREGDIASAKKWYGEAIQLGADSYLTHYYYARTCIQAGDKGEDGAIESNLRAAIKLNPNFAPAYDALASFYASRHEKLDEAHLLNIQAVQLEPNNLNYRINAADVLADNQKFYGALGVLKLAAQIAKTPAETDLVQSRIRHIEEDQARLDSIQKANSPIQNANSPIQNADSPIQHANSEATARTTVLTRMNGKMVITPATAPSTGPKYPTEAPTGVHHTIRGILRGVQCFYPSVITLSVEQAGKTVALYSNNYFHIDFSAVNYTPSGDIHPCTSIEGMKAQVVYAEVPDKTIAGQILSIELSK